MKSMTWAGACKNFFGLKPGQTLQEFGAEIKALTPGDKAEMISLFKTVDITVEEKIAA